MLVVKFISHISLALEQAGFENVGLARGSLRKMQTKSKLVRGRNLKPRLDHSLIL